ncbi:MAG TPA: RdgB/HAM1 family non-canonical purine NTP pyrophosphatase [Dongiaceae bacterium]|nr:RdgB/HAM1 family non-canonical purine NTP pyrophosphatase [Dongiaceae bacterium]
MSAKQLYLASSNPGKLREFAEIGQGEPAAIALALLPGFAALPAYPEDAPTFAENAVGKALHASGATEEAVLADDSGLVVPSLGGAPGVLSARYAGAGATGAQNIAKLLDALKGKSGGERRAYFVCALAVARRGKALAVVTNRVDGEILEAARGAGGFGYDPVFYFPPLQKSFAEITASEKNTNSHRGKAFRRLLAVLPSML